MAKGSSDGKKKKLKKARNTTAESDDHSELDKKNIAEVPAKRADNDNTTVINSKKDVDEMEENGLTGEKQELSECVNKLSLMISGLDKKANEFTLLGKFPAASNVQIVKERRFNENLQIGFVDFKNEALAKAALDNSANKIINGIQVSVEYADQMKRIGANDRKTVEKRRASEENCETNAKKFKSVGTVSDEIEETLRFTAEQNNKTLLIMLPREMHHEHAKEVMHIVEKWTSDIVDIIQSTGLSCM